METKESVQTNSSQEQPVNKDVERRKFLLRTLDSNPVKVAGKEYTNQEKGTEIYVDKQLPRKSILKLPTEKGISYYEVIEPSKQYVSDSLNSVWLQEVPISEDDFRLLSEKRRGYNLYSLPLAEKTMKELGTKETIPQKIKEELISETKRIENTPPTPLEDATPDNLNTVNRTGGETAETFKASPGRKLDPERLKTSLENAKKGKKWKGEEKDEQPIEKTTETYKAMGGSEMLKKIEKARDLLERGNYEEAKKLVDEMKTESSATAKAQLTETQNTPILESMPEGQESAPLKEVETTNEVDYLLYHKTGSFIETPRVRRAVGDEERPVRLPPLKENQILKVDTLVGESYYKTLLMGPVQQRLAEKNVPENIKNPYFVKRIETQEELNELKNQGYEIVSPPLQTQEELPKAA